jgi:hypothetical protein
MQNTTQHNAAQNNNIKLYLTKTALHMPLRIRAKSIMRFSKTTVCIMPLRIRANSMMHLSKTTLPIMSLSIMLLRISTQHYASQQRRLDIMPLSIRKHSNMHLSKEDSA